MKYKAFVVYVAIFNVELDDKMYLLRKTQIDYLKADKVLIEDIFLSKWAAKFLKYMGKNNYTIKLVDD